MTLRNLIEMAPTLEQHNAAIARTLQDEPWGPIVRFDAPDLPPFPTDIFAPWLRAFVEAEAEATQTPIDLAGMLALAVLATCCQRWIMVQGRPDWIEPVNLFTVTALPPASRKSTVFRAFVAPLLAYEQQQVAYIKQVIAETESQRDVLEERLNTAKRNAAKSKSSDAMDEVNDLTEQLRQLETPAVPRLIVDDVTPEALATLLVEQGGRMAALSPEGDVFAIMAGRYSGTSGPNFGVFLKAHAGDTLRVDRRNRSEFVDWPALTLGITTQPDVVRGLAEKAGFRGQGLLGRFLYALPDNLVGRRKIDPEPVPVELRQAYHEHIATLLAWRQTHFGNSGNSENNGDRENESLIAIFTNISILKISPLAITLLTDFLAWIEPQLAADGALGAFADWAGKLAGAILRIAGLLHIAEQLGSHNSHNSHNEISEATLAAAFRMANYLIAHARAAFFEMGSDSAMAGARRALAWIEDRRAHEFTKRDLFQGIKGTIPKADDIDPILKVLCDYGYIRPMEMSDRGGPGRRPSPRYETHPDVLNGSHNSHNSHNRAPMFTPRTQSAKNGTAETVDVDMDAVRMLLNRGDEARVRAECAKHGLNADLVIAQARGASGYRSVEGFD